MIISTSWSTAFSPGNKGYRKKANKILPKMALSIIQIIVGNCSVKITMEITNLAQKKLGKHTASRPNINRRRIFRSTKYKFWSSIVTRTYIRYVCFTIYLIKTMKNVLERNNETEIWKQHTTPQLGTHFLPSKKIQTCIKNTLLLSTRITKMSHSRSCLCTCPHFKNSYQQTF